MTVPMSRSIMSAKDDDEELERAMTWSCQALGYRLEVYATVA